MIPRGFLARLLAGLCGTVVPKVLAILRESSRIRPQNESIYRDLTRDSENFILAFWHGQMLPVLFYFQSGGFYTFISPHRDGEYIARTIQGMNHHALRTSLRDPSIKALGRALKLAKSGEPLAVTPDGPIGPRFEARTGTMKLSQKTGLPVLPVAGIPGRAHFFSSWDRFCFPFPLGTIHVRFGQPIFPDEIDSLEQGTRQLEHRLNAISREASAGLHGIDDYRAEFSELEP